MTDSKRSEEEVHVPDPQIIRIDKVKRRRDSVSSACKRRIADDRAVAKRRGGSHQSSSQMRRDTSNCHENLKYLIEPIWKIEYNK